MQLFNFNAFIILEIRSNYAHFKGYCSTINTENFKLTSFDDLNKGPSIEIEFGDSAPLNF